MWCRWNWRVLCYRRLFNQSTWHHFFHPPSHCNNNNNTVPQKKRNHSAHKSCVFDQVWKWTHLSSAPSIVNSTKNLRRIQSVWSTNYRWNLMIYKRNSTNFQGILWFFFSHNSENVKIAYTTKAHVWYINHERMCELRLLSMREMWTSHINRKHINRNMLEIRKHCREKSKQEKKVAVAIDFYVSQSNNGLYKVTKEGRWNEWIKK